MKLSLASAFLASPESAWITAQVRDDGQLDYIGHSWVSTESRPRIP